MADDAKIQLQGSILSSLAQRNTPTSAKPSSLPTSIISQNITPSSNNSIDSGKMTSALATISNKLEKGFAQTVSVLTNMQIAITSRLETINRQLQQMNDLMKHLNQTQIQLMKQRSDMGTYGLRLVEIFNTRMVQGFIKLREQLIQPLSREAINMAFLRVFMDNPDIRKYFGYRVEEHRRRQRAATFTYEIYQTVLNIPNFINNAAEQIINEFRNSIQTVNKTLNANLKDGLLNLFERHHGFERAHWLRMEGSLRELIICCYEQLQPKNIKLGRDKQRQYRAVRAQVGEVAGFEDRKTKRTGQIQASFKEQKKFRQSIIEKITAFAGSQKDTEKYHIKSLDIFDKLLRHTMTMSDAVTTMVFRVLLNPKGIMYKIIKQMLTITLTAKLIRGVLSYIPETFYKTSVAHLTTGFNFLGSKLFTIFDTILPQRFKETFFNTTKGILGFIKNFGTMLFSQDEDKRKEARGLFLSNLQTILTKLFVAFVRPISRLLLTFLAARGIYNKWKDYSAKANAGLNVPEAMKNRTAGQRASDMGRGRAFFSRQDIASAPKNAWRWLRHRNTPEYKQEQAQRHEATDKARAGQNMYVNGKPWAGQKMGDIIPNIVKGAAKAPWFIKSILGSIINVFTGVGTLIVKGMQYFSIGTLIYSIVNMFLNAYRESGEENVGNFIDTIFSSLKSTIIGAFKAIITKGPQFIWQVIKATISGAIDLVMTIGSYLLGLIKETYYNIISTFVDTEYEIALIQEQRRLIEANSIQAKKQEVDAQQSTEPSSQGSMLDVVTKIKNYFIGGTFEESINKTAATLGSGIKSIVETLADAANTFANGMQAGGEMLMGGLSKIVGGFMYGIHGNESASILQKASEIAAERGWHGTASFLKQSQNTAEQMIKDAADKMKEASSEIVAASEIQVFAAITNAQTARDYVTTLKTLEAEIVKRRKADDKAGVEEYEKKHRIATAHWEKSIMALNETELRELVGDAVVESASKINDEFLRYTGMDVGGAFDKLPILDAVRRQQGLTKPTKPQDVRKINGSIFNTYTGAFLSGIGGVDTPGASASSIAAGSTIGQNTPVNSNAFFGLPRHARMTSPYNQRRTDQYGNPRYHRGVDFGGMQTGTPLIAPVLGRVVDSGWHTGYGHTMAIHYPDYGVYFKYGHLDSRHFSKGQIVKPGDILGRVGNTGGNYKTHLHLEAIPDSVPVNQLFQKDRYAQITFDPFNLYESYKRGTLKSVSPTSFLANATKKHTMPEGTYKPQQVLTYETNKDAMSHLATPGNTPPIVVNNYDSTHVQNTSNVNTSLDNTSSNEADMTYMQMISLFTQGVGF